MLAGVCGAGDRADRVHCGHCLSVCPTPHPANLLGTTALLAFLLQSLESDPHRLPLLSGHHHSSWIPTPGGTPRAWGGTELHAMVASPIYGKDNLGSSEARILFCCSGQNVFLNLHRAGMTLLLSPSVRSAFTLSQREHTTAASVIGGSWPRSEPHLMPFCCSPRAKPGFN